MKLRVAACGTAVLVLGLLAIGPATAQPYPPYGPSYGPPPVYGPYGPPPVYAAPRLVSRGRRGISAPLSSRPERGLSARRPTRAERRVSAWSRARPVRPSRRGRCTLRRSRWSAAPAGRERSEEHT